jgi:hypothetical protein
MLLKFIETNNDSAINSRVDQCSSFNAEITYLISWLY